MGPKIDPVIEKMVRELAAERKPPSEICEYLKTARISLSVKTIYRITRSIGKRREALSKGLAAPKNSYQPLKLNSNKLNIINRMTSGPHPKSQTEIANRVGVTQQRISQIAKEKLHKKVFKKRKVHRLTESHKANRKINSRKLYERHLAGKKSEFVVTLDEALFYAQDSNKTSEIFYSRHGKEVENYVCEKRERFCDKLMVVGALTGRGTLPLIPVRNNAKVNSKYYVDNVLKRLLEEELPNLYPGELDKVFVHHDAASSHTARFTQQYAKELQEKLGITIIPNKEIPVKSPDISPMDFYGFGFLKQRLAKRRAKKIAGVWKCLNDEWDKITPEMCRNVFQNWKTRLRAVSRSSGEHIEGTRTIHKRRL